tara:strand:+ start:252 stop:1190 length:939 start_codon:yes stop_codon:yes gene_type:complete
MSIIKKIIGNAILYLGDSNEILSEIKCVDAVVTDPPYGLSFMGKQWDYDVPQKELWEKVYQPIKQGGHLLSFFGSRTYHRGVIPIEDAGFEIRDQLMWLYGSGFPKSHNIGKKAEEYEGWGTALKPAHEPIVMARKPFKGSVAENVLEHGTGGINIDGCRVGTEKLDTSKNRRKQSSHKKTVFKLGLNNKPGGEIVHGRFPANVMHDGSDVVQDVFGDKSRYFYCAKTSKQDREVGNNHPTVKPTELMRYLCRLVTPKGGVILDPFMGSGSTGKGALLEGFRFIGIEMEREYFDIASARLEAAQKNVQEVLF